MVRVKLDQEWTDKLLALPENGMGYQRVRVRLRDGRTIDEAVALNAELVQVPDEVGPFKSSDITAIEPSTTAGN